MQKDVLFNPIVIKFNIKMTLTLLLEVADKNLWRILEGLDPLLQDLPIPGNYKI